MREVGSTVVSEGLDLNGCNNADLNVLVDVQERDGIVSMGMDNVLEKEFEEGSNIMNEIIVSHVEL